MHPSYKVILFPTEAQERALAQWFGYRIVQDKESGIVNDPNG